MDSNTKKDKKDPYFNYSVGEAISNKYDLHFHEHAFENGIESDDVDNNFFHRLFEDRHPSFNIEDFLDYQFQCTTYEKDDFIDHIKTITRIKKDTYYQIREFTPEHEAIEHRVFNWIDNKLLLLSLKIQSVERETYLTDIQLAFLVEFFFKYLTIELRVQVNRSDIVKLLHVVTGLPFTSIQNSKFNDCLKEGIYAGKGHKTARHLENIQMELKRVELKNVLTLVQAEIKSNNIEIDGTNEISTRKDKK